MASPTLRMDAAQFDHVASQCRWSERSLAVVRDVLVDGVALSIAAQAHDMSTNQARVLLARFTTKVTNLRLETFMQRERPKLAVTTLEPYSNEVRTLRDKGYTVEQIVTFFKENGVSTSMGVVRKFLRNLRA